MKCKKWSKLLCLIITGIVVTGCAGKTQPKDKLRDLEFSVLDEKDIPEPLMEVIQKNLKTEMKLSYQKDGELYLARGFGEQPTGGYSIAISQVYLAEDGIHGKFQLIGPEHGEKLTETPSYPYVVIQMEDLEESIHFE